MKKILMSIAICSISLLTQAQDSTKVKTPGKLPAAKADTIFVLSMEEFKQFATALNNIVDSKAATKELILFIQQKGRIVQPADKPKN